MSDSLTVSLNGTLRFCAVIDGYTMAIELHPCGADGTAVARALAALQGAMQALENHSWPTPKRTASPSRLTLDAPSST